MGPASAAVARTAPRARRPDLHARLRVLLERAAEGEASGLAERLLPTHPRAGGRLPPHEGFYWLLISGWLAESLGLATSAAGRTLLAELEWIQYCVYGVFRVQDDLVDGETADPRLAVEANHLMVEAAARAARRFAGDSPFWSVFRATIGATSRAIVRLDRIQRTAQRRAHVELELYAELAACLKIAAAGVALASGREADWRQRISPALDRIAVAAQVLDDLHDLRDDLADGRVNYAAWYLGRPGLGASPEEIEAAVAASLLDGSRLSRLFESLDRLMAEAVDRLPAMLCARTHGYLRDYREGLGVLRDQILGRRSALLDPARAS